MRRTRPAPSVPEGSDPLPARLRSRARTCARRVESAGEARERLAGVGAVLEQRAPKVARLLEAAEDDLLACMAFAAEHRCNLRSTSPLERVNREIGRCPDVVGIYPNDAALLRLAGSLLIERRLQACRVVGAQTAHAVDRAHAKP